MIKLISFLTCATAAVAAVLQSRDDTSCSAGSITSNARTCTVECGVDHIGGDYTSLSTTSWPDCMNACTGDPACTTAQYSLNSGWCYLKNTTNPSTANPGVSSIVCKTSAPDTCIAGNITLNGRSGVLQCGYDYPGGDYSSQYTGSPLACQNLCASDLNCLTAQYNQNTKYCYLKHSINPSIVNNNVWSLVFPPIATTTPQGCMSYAPASPFLQNPGFEQGSLGWIAPSPSNSYGYSTGFITNGIALEGCNALVVTPTARNDGSRLCYAANKVTFQGTSSGKLYNLSIKVGTPNSTALAPGSAPSIGVVALTQTAIPVTPICGWANSGACPIQGVGGASGQLVTGQFQGGAFNTYIYIYVYWYSGTATYNPVLLDDLQVTPA